LISAAKSLDLRFRQNIAHPFHARCALECSSEAAALESELKGGSFAAALQGASRVERVSDVLAKTQVE